MTALGGSLVGRLLARLNLRFPWLFALFAMLTAIDLLVPDLIPFADEIVLALLTLLIGSWKRRKAAGTGSISSVKPGP